MSCSYRRNCLILEQLAQYFWMYLLWKHCLCKVVDSRDCLLSTLFVHNKLLNITINSLISYCFVIKPTECIIFTCLKKSNLSVPRSVHRLNLLIKHNRFIPIIVINCVTLRSGFYLLLSVVCMIASLLLAMKCLIRFTNSLRHNSSCTLNSLFTINRSLSLSLIAILCWTARTRWQLRSYGTWNLKPEVKNRPKIR